MRKEIVKVDDKGRVELPDWAWKRLLKMSGSKARTWGGKRRAIRKEFIKCLERTCQQDMSSKLRKGDK